MWGGVERILLMGGMFHPTRVIKVVGSDEFTKFVGLGL